VAVVVDQQDQVKPFLAQVKVVLAVAVQIIQLQDLLSIMLVVAAAVLEQVV
jgi:hypothetical protein